MPKIACKFSFIAFLHLASVDRLKTFIFRGEFRCLAVLFKNSVRRKMQQVERMSRRTSQSLSWWANKYPVTDLSLNDSGDSSRQMHSPNGTWMKSAFTSGIRKDVGQDTGRGLAFNNMIGTLFCFFLIGVSIASFVVKFTLLYFVAIYPAAEWMIEEWFLFVGFINQLSGIALSSELEMLRVLLFKFGGEKSFWGSEQIEACSTYFHYLAARTVEQIGPLRGVILMWTLSSAELQSLFIGHMRTEEQSSVRHQEVEMFDVLHDKERLIEMRDGLVSDFAATQGSLNELLKLTSEHRRMEALNDAQKTAIGKLRLACRVQEFIWEWSKVELLEAPFDSTDEMNQTLSEDIENHRITDMRHGMLGTSTGTDSLPPPPTSFVTPLAPVKPCSSVISCVSDVSDF